MESLHDTHHLQPLSAPLFLFLHTSTRILYIFHNTHTSRSASCQGLKARVAKAKSYRVNCVTRTHPPTFALALNAYDIMKVLPWSYAQVTCTSYGITGRKGTCLSLRFFTSPKLSHLSLCMSWSVNHSINWNFITVI